METVWRGGICGLATVRGSRQKRRPADSRDPIALLSAHRAGKPVEEAGRGGRREPFQVQQGNLESAWESVSLQPHSRFGEVGLADGGAAGGIG